jgi:hypothetical protein
MTKMNSVINKYKRMIVPALVLALGIVSCKKDEVGSNELVRMFMPGDISVISGDTIATLSWKASLYTTGTDVSYTIELSRDSLFAGTPELSQVTNSTQITVTDEQLAVKQKYFARLKANAVGNSGESYWVYSSGMTPIRGAQIFLPVLDGELTESKVTLRWKVTSGVTKITLTGPGGKVDYTVDAGESAAGKKTITGLTPKTAYTAAIFVGNAEKGNYPFTTFADIPTGANIVMVQATDDLAAMLTTAATGTTFVLLQGTKYTTDAAVVLPDNASFTIWGQSGPNRPILAFNGITLPATAGTIRFENLDFTGYQNADPALSKRNYIFNQSAATTTSEIIFENCIIRNLVNTPLRAQGSAAITIDKTTIDKCIIYDIGWNGSNGSYAFINNSVATSRFNNIYITNNTFYNIGYGLVLHSQAPSTTLQVDNNTFYNVTGDGRYMIDYNAQVVTAFSFTNNVIGKTASPAGTARGIRSTTAPTVGNNTYKTSDCAFSANPIANINDYSKASTDLFTDPAGGNFLYKDENFLGKSTSGDPRWRY